MDARSRKLICVCLISITLVSLTLGLKEIDPHQFEYNEDPLFAKREGELESPPSPSETNPACYVQTCEQFIIGRDLTYKEALHIVQNEKYLNVADIERVVQRRTRRSVPSHQTIPSELESRFRRPKRDTSDETGFKSALQRLGREGVTFFGENRWLSVSKTVSASGNDTINFDPIQDVLLSLVPMVGLLVLGTTLVGNPVLPLVTADLIPPGNPEPGTLAGGGKPADAPFSTLDLAVGLDREVVATFPPFDSAQSYSAEAIIFSEIQNIKKYADTQVLNIGRKKRSPLFGSWLTGNRRRGRGRGKGKPRARAQRQRAPRPRAPRRPLQKRPRGPKRLQPQKKTTQTIPFPPSTTTKTLQTPWSPKEKLLTPKRPQ